MTDYFTNTDLNDGTAGDKYGAAVVRLSEKAPEKFRPFLAVHVPSGVVTVKRNPEPIEGGSEGCFRFRE